MHAVRAPITHAYCMPRMFLGRRLYDEELVELRGPVVDKIMTHVDQAIVCIIIIHFNHDLSY